MKPTLKEDLEAALTDLKDWIVECGPNNKTLEIIETLEARLANWTDEPVAMAELAQQSQEFGMGYE